MAKRSFTEELSFLCARELPCARRDPEKGSEMLERLAAALGMTASVLAGGDPQRIDKLIAAAEAHAHGEAVRFSGTAEFISAFGRPGND